MEVLQIIQGREAVPVRAIPFLTGWTGWKTMPPIAIAKALAGTDDQGDFAGLTAYKLRTDGSIKKTLQQEWLMVAKDLKGIRATTLKDAQTSHDAWHHAWSKQAIPILPAGVFVWRDEFAEQHASSYFSLRRIDFETGGYSTKKPPELAFDIEVRPPWDSLVLEGFAPAKAPAQAQQSHQETPAPKTAPVTDPAGHEAKPASARRPYYRMGWQQTAAFEHVVNVYASIAPATAKQLCAELKKSAIGDTALGVKRGGLFVRETGKALNDKTIENSLPTIRIQAQKLPRESHFPAKHSRE